MKINIRTDLEWYNSFNLNSADKSIECNYCYSELHITCVQIKDLIIKAVNDWKLILAAKFSAKLQLSEKTENVEANTSRLIQNTLRLFDIFDGSVASNVKPESIWLDIVKRNIRSPLIIVASPKTFHQLPQVERGCAIAYLGIYTAHPSNSNSTLNLSSCTCYTL